MTKPKSLPPWYPDERALAGSEHTDPSYVQGYDAKAGEAAAADARRLPSLGLRPGATVVDLGAGTGSFAMAAADLNYRVVAVDISEAMLDAAASKNVGNRVAFVSAGLLTYEHEPPLAEMVYSRNALHHLPDFWKAMALGRIKSILRPGGLLWLRDIVFSSDPSEAPRAIDAWLTAAPEEPRSGWTREELERHLRDEHSTFSWLLEPMIERSGFSIREKHYSENRMFAEYLCELDRFEQG